MGFFFFSALFSFSHFHDFISEFGFFRKGREREGEEDGLTTVAEMDCWDGSVEQTVVAAAALHSMTVVADVDLDHGEMDASDVDSHDTAAAVAAAALAVV